MYQALLLCAVKTTCYVRAVETVPGITPCGHVIKTRHRKFISYARIGARTIVGPKLNPVLVPSERVSRALGLLAFQKFFCGSFVEKKKKKKKKKKNNNNNKKTTFVSKHRNRDAPATFHLATNDRNRQRPLPPSPSRVRMNPSNARARKKNE